MREVGGPVPAGHELPPAFDVGVAADAKQIHMRVTGEARTRSEGVTRVERATVRDGLPDHLRRGERYTDVHTSYRVAAWLDEADECSDL